MEVVMDWLAFTYRNLSKKNLNPHYLIKIYEGNLLQTGQGGCSMLTGSAIQQCLSKFFKHKTCRRYTRFWGARWCNG